jgi:hypothetical protein
MIVVSNAFTISKFALEMKAQLQRFPTTLPVLQISPRLLEVKIFHVF